MKLFAASALRTHAISKYSKVVSVKINYLHAQRILLRRRHITPA